MSTMLQWLKKLLREDDEVVYGDSAYLELEKRDEIKHNPCFSAIEFRINRGRAGCPEFRTTPLTGSDTLSIANPLCAARWNTLTES